MQNEENLNLLSQKPASVKNNIIQKLSRQWPLTIKQLHHALTREQGINTSYQAVHKAITQLEEEKIVEKELNGYQLNIDWIQKIAKLSNQINTSYETGFALDPEKETHYSLCPNNTPLDKGMVEWMKKIGKKCRTGVPISLDHDYVVKGDHVCQIYYPTPFAKKIDEIYQKISSLTKLFETYFINTEKDEEFEIEMTISINPTLSKLIQEKIKKYFGE